MIIRSKSGEKTKASILRVEQQPSMMTSNLHGMNKAAMFLEKHQREDNVVNGVSF